MIKITKVSQINGVNRNRVSIKFIVSDAMVKMNDMIRIVFEDEYRYFKINELEIDEYNYVGIATQYGYYNMFHKQDYNLKKLIGLKPILIFDKETIEKLKNENDYC